MKYTPKECFGCAKDNKQCAAEKDFTKMECVKDWPAVDDGTGIGPVQVVHCPDAVPRENQDHARVMEICYQEGTEEAYVNAYSANLAALKARPACKLKEIGDQWRTPERLYIGINAKFGPFTLDLFTDGDNSKCVNFYTAEQNALLQDWASDLKQFGGSAFANPPYSRESKDNNGEYVTGMRHIIDKALAERDAGARIVFLIKATPSETWWPEEADHIVFIKGRIGFDVPEWFVPEEGSATKAGAGFASAVAIFDKNWRGEKMSYISRDELEFIGQHWLDAVDAKARQLVAAQLEVTRAAEPTAAVDDVAPSVVVEPEPEQPACVASAEDMNCPDSQEGCPVANCVSEEQETAPEVAATVTDAPETVTEDPADELPTLRAEIDDLRVRSALEAAFGLRDEYSFSESKFAHTWVADSFEQPTFITVHADVLTRAISLCRQQQGVELIDNSDCTESQVERLVGEPEAKTIEPEPEAAPEPEQGQPACVDSNDDVSCPGIQEGFQVADAVTDTLETVTEEQIDLEKSLSESQKRQMAELIDNSGCTESQLERLHAVSDDVLWGASEWCIPVMRELIERVKENGLENIREMRVEMRLIAERQMREFFNPRSGAPSLGCSKHQIQSLCDVLWEVEHGFFGPFEKSDLMPVFNQLVGYVRRASNVNGRLMRVYLQERTVINGHVPDPEQVNQ